MLRTLLIYLSKAGWAPGLVTKWRFARRTASRFVAGENAEDAIQVSLRLNAKGMSATLDPLGERTTRPDDAQKATVEITRLLDKIERRGARASVSIKLTHIGLKFDEAICEKNLTCILERAKANNNFVRIDMEDSPYTERTLEMVRRMQKAGFRNTVGAVIQAYLYQSEQDLLRLISDRTNVRLCKGAYAEPRELAYPRKQDVDANYDHLARVLLDGTQGYADPTARPNGKVPPPTAIATHDERRIRHVINHAQQNGLPKTALEFQMLFGIRRELQGQLAAEGYPVRIYIPYGIEWFPYFMRRLAERPANLWFFLSNLFRK